MKKNRLTEPERLKDLDGDRAHSDGLADLLPHELEPFEQLKGSVKKFDRPADPTAYSEDSDA